MSKDIVKNEGKSSKTRGRPKKEQKPSMLELINRDAAGIDIGATSHFVAVPEGSVENNVREFRSTTPGIYALADWLKECGVKTIAMESTGVYWICLYEVLEEKGFEVKLVDARQTKNVAGRKTDVSDCQWIQQLHTYGLLEGAFRPKEDICVLRTYIRQRSMLVEDASREILHMQKALTQMNLKLQHVISDVTGETGIKIVRAIVDGARDPEELSGYRDFRCKSSKEEIKEALTGNYREEHIFTLKQALERYDHIRGQISACDVEIEKQLNQFSVQEKVAELPEDKLNPNKKRKWKGTPEFELGKHLHRLTGVDLLAVPGISELSALKIISEIGLDMTKWRNAKQFASWLGLSPVNKISGGKRLSGKTKPTNNRAAETLRIAAASLIRSQTPLGAFLRRLKSRKGPAKAITATAHKMAKILYTMLRYGVEYKDLGQENYEEQYKTRLIKNLKKMAAKLCMELVPANQIVEKNLIENQAVGSS
jgi:transposase